MKEAAKENLAQISYLLQNITNKQYTAQTEVLSGSTIGGHIRHILEFYLLLVSGSVSGIISYDTRKRDKKIESDPVHASKTIDMLLYGINRIDEEKPIKLEADFSSYGGYINRISSSVGRELAYCIEHSVHHQALIKAGLIALGLKELIDENFGVACSTIRYRQKESA
jgi:hypothetical protein